MICLQGVFWNVAFGHILFESHSLFKLCVVFWWLLLIRNCLQDAFQNSQSLLWLCVDAVYYVIEYPAMRFPATADIILYHTT